MVTRRGQTSSAAGEGMREEDDATYGITTWRKLGLCAGQGGEGPSDARWGPCLGGSCRCFHDACAECAKDPSFAKGQRVRCRGCGQSVLRKDSEHMLGNILKKRPLHHLSKSVRAVFKLSSRMSEGRTRMEILGGSRQDAEGF